LRARGATAGLAAFALTLLIFCAPRRDAGTDSPSDEAAADADLREIVYDVGWRWGDIERSDDSWQVVNDLGYVVTLSRGYIVSYSMELVECTDGSDEGDTASTPLDWLRPRPAFAGHPSGTNPAAIYTSRVESLIALEASEAGRLTVAPYRYCRLHYLIARGQEGTADLPDDADMIGASVVVEGTYVHTDALSAGDVGATPFSYRTAIANGLLVDIEPIDVSNGDVSVYIERDVRGLFDGVDFAIMSDREIEFQLLRQLIDGSSVDIDIN